MPQSGLHGLSGLPTARALIGRVPREAHAAFVFATIFGAVAPDIDLYPTAIGVTFFNQDVYVLHRSFTHNIFVLLLLYVLGLCMRKPAWRWGLWGLGIGCLTHELLDIFFWFAKLDLFWPLSLPHGHGMLPVVDVWGDNKALKSGPIPNIRDAFEFPFFALMLLSIRRCVHRVRPDLDMKKQRVWETVLWCYFPVTIATAFLSTKQQLWVNVPILFAFLPYCWSRVWIYRYELAAWCRFKNTGELDSPWQDWDGTVRCEASSIEYPTTEAEVAAIVKRAIDERKVVRVFGAGHSWSPLVPTDGILVNLDRLHIEPVIDTVNRKATLSAGMRLRDAGPLLQKHGLTFQNVGAITPQSIAGAMGTGTHGTGLDFGVIGSQVSAVRIVDGHGNICDYNAVDHPEEMSALRLSLGCLGIITRVTLDCVDDYSVELETSTMSYRDFIKEFDNLYKTKDRIRAYWFPRSNIVSIHRMKRVETPTKPGTIYTKLEIFTRRWVLGVFWRLGQKCHGLIPLLNFIEEKVGYAHVKRVGRCFDAIITPLPAHHQEAEVAVPLEHGNESIEMYRRKVERDRYPVNVPSEIRFTKGDDILLSPGYPNVDTCYIGGYNAIYREKDTFFEEFCEELQDNFFARPHWGKIGAPTRKEALARFPGFEKFSGIRLRFDPNNVFANEYIRKLFDIK